MNDGATPRATGSRAPSAARDGQVSSRLPGRSLDDRVLAGVAAGVGRWLHVDANLVRAAFVILALAGGVGVVLYVLFWALTRDRAHRGQAPPAHPRQALALGLVVVGLLLAFRSVGLWFGDAVVWPLALALAGTAAVLPRSGTTHTAATPLGRDPGALVSGRAGLVRVAIGTTFVAVGIAALVATNMSITVAGTLLVAAFATAGGLALILAPWLWRLGRELTAERRERIRADERAEMAAHLHDSVLQTLAMIQRAESMREAVTLARGQERELRAWLYGARREPDGHIRPAVEDLAGRVEARHGVAVETVVVGDAALDETAEVVLGAATEAAMNAAEHSGASSVSVYVEVEPHAISAFVRDRGTGFDLDRVSPGGITDSIIGRMERHGGQARMSTTPGEGTEVSLRIARPTPEDREDE